MRFGARIMAAAGILVVLIAFLWRLHSAKHMPLMESRSGSLLLIGNTLILFSVLFAVLNLNNKAGGK